MSNPSEPEPVPKDPEQVGQILFELFGPACMELVRRFGDDGCDELLHELAEGFAPAFVLAITAAQLGENTEE